MTDHALPTADSTPAAAETPPNDNSRGRRGQGRDADRASGNVASASEGGKGAGKAGKAGDRGGKGGKGGGRPVPRPVHPLLLQLADLHPRLFGPQPRPLKLGIFEDLVAAHGEALVPAELKLALGQHVRSSRYLKAVAEGHPRCGLDGEPVQAAAPEHVLHAVMEIWRRRQGRDPQAARAWALGCIAHALEPVHTGGQDRADWLAQVRTQDPQALALVDEAWSELAGFAAKREALRRAFEASGQSVEAFADMYGMDLDQVKDALAN
jgi:hypothetical protein